MNVHKSVKVLGISESFIRGVSKKSFLAGVVMRGDMAIDDFVVSTVTVGGMDSTEKIMEMYKNLDRDDINLLLLNGCIISWYNVIDLNKISAKTRLPLICVTYRESLGIERFFKKFFPKDWDKRIEIYLKNKSRIPIKLHTGYTIYVRFINMNLEEAKRRLNKFTLEGAIPEPLRVARLLARCLCR